MGQSNKVVWSEGLFLRPQHFQQQERYLERYVDRKFAALTPYDYGFAELVIDRELLKFGKLGIARARGVMPDGTPFDIPDDAPIPTPLDIPADVKEEQVVLALALRRPGMPDVAFAPAANTTLIRHFAADHQSQDAVLEMDSVADLKVGDLHLKLQLRSDVSMAFSGIAFAQVRERRADGQVLLEDGFIPPLLDTRVSLKLFDMLKEIYGLLKHRALALAERVSQPGSKGVADFSDFLLLQLCNRNEPLYAHLTQRELVHPELFYSHAIALAGELGTFGRKERRAMEFGPYRHDDLDGTFRPVLEEIRQALTAVLDQTAIPIALQDRGRGVFVGTVPDVNLLRAASFVLAVNADLPSEQLRVHFPTQVKIGSVEKIRDLVMSHLPGIVTRAMPVAPRQIPYHAGFTYFELDRKSEFWRGLEVSRVIAMHIAGEFPGLQLELWAIRD